jgi:hypothetical protein
MIVFGNQDVFRQTFAAKTLLLFYPHIGKRPVLSAAFHLCTNALSLPEPRISPLHIPIDWLSCLDRKREHNFFNNCASILFGLHLPQHMLCRSSSYTESGWGKKLIVHKLDELLGSTSATIRNGRTRLSHDDLNGW